MKNPKLYWLLSQINLTPAKIAADPRVLSSRAHVTECLLNKAGRGKHTRKRIVRVISPIYLPMGYVTDFPEEMQLRYEILRELGWDSAGNLLSPALSSSDEAREKNVPRGETQLEQVAA